MLIIAGGVGWLTFAALIARMYAQTPPGAGFDLDLLLTGGRRVADGLSPYEPSMLAGHPVAITSLFFSYPPLVAQALAPFAPAPTVAVLAVLLLAAPLAAADVSVRITRLYEVPAAGRRAFAVALSLLPFWFPFTLAMLFGNLDTLFVAGYGLVLLAVLPGPLPSRAAVVAAGISLALMSVTKLHPAILGVWLLVRGVREWRRAEPRVEIGGGRLPRSWAVAGIAAITTTAVLLASLVSGGPGPWSDYLTVLRASTVVDLIDPRNLGPAVQVALLLGLGQDALAPMQAVVVVGALAVAVVSALAIDDPLEGVLWATFASLVPLPVTWFHHFAVLFPFGVAAVARASVPDSVTPKLILGLVVVALAIGAVGFGTVGTWLLLPLAVILVRISRRAANRSTRAQVVASAVARAG